MSVGSENKRWHLASHRLAARAYGQKDAGCTLAAKGYGLCENSVTSDRSANDAEVSRYSISISRYRDILIVKN